MRDDPTTVARSARDVVLAGYAADAAAVGAALRSDDDSVRERAVWATERAGIRTVPVRVELLRDPSAGVRRTACRLEARRPAPSSEVAAALLECLADSDPLVAAAAADALGEMGWVAGVQELSRIVRTHDDPRCREAAVAALGSLGAPEGLAAVLEALHDKPAVRRRAVVALAAFDSPLVDAALDTALADRDWQVRQAAEALRDDANEPGDAH